MSATPRSSPRWRRGRVWVGASTREGWWSTNSARTQMMSLMTLVGERRKKIRLLQYDQNIQSRRRRKKRRRRRMKRRMKMKMICQNMTCGEMMMKELKRKQLNHHQNLKSTPLNDPEVNPDPEIGTARDLEGAVTTTLS